MKSRRYELRYTDARGRARRVTFIPNGRKRVNAGDGFVYANIDVRLPDGRIVQAVGGFDESSSGEHYETIVMLEDPDLFTDLHSDAANERLGEIFPYSYRLRVPLHCHDHHCDETTGWSR